MSTSGGDAGSGSASRVEQYSGISSVCCRGGGAQCVALPHALEGVIAAFSDTVSDAVSDSVSDAVSGDVRPDPSLPGAGLVGGFSA